MSWRLIPTVEFFTNGSHCTPLPAHYMENFKYRGQTLKWRRDDMAPDRSQYPFKKKKAMLSECCHCWLDYVWVRCSMLRCAFTNPLKQLPALGLHSWSFCQKTRCDFQMHTFTATFWARHCFFTRPIVSFTSWTAEALFHVHNFNRAEFKRTVRKVYSRWYELQRCLGEKRWCVKIINLYYFSE